ncbi:Alpha-glucosidase 2 [Escovopsis weberi]|uniref:alpha-glucosidase n=1 Tax=Escovopsis weberi TaxID=150374 RepID=A0A0M8MUN3_ESCWE|nr:Alpha-glucosidase 2 [Escovopsis weberi]
MPQSERVPLSWAADGRPSSHPLVSLKSTDAALPFRFTFEALRPGVFRTTFTSDSHPLPPHPSVPAVSPRIDKDMSLEFAAAETSASIRNGPVTAEVDWKDSSPVVRVFRDGQDTALHEDVPYRSYTADGPGIAHYSRYDRNTLYVGLGEKAAPMNLNGRKFTLSATDSFGYDVYRTDPLYKHIPLLISARPGGCVATFSSTHSRGSFSIGSEMDGMWGRYKVYRQDHGGLEQYTLVGATLREVVRLFADLAGHPLLVPRWAFGYLSGGMKYSMLDDPPASEALLALAGRMKEEDIPCSAYQMSSGYTVAETPPKTRNVFTWNRHRFRDPEAFIREYRRLGMRLIANVKPYVLGNHPEYEKLKAAGALFVDPHTKTTAVARLWSAGGGESAEGGHIDFTSEAGFRWWYEGVKKLREQGIVCIWNDNNEYVVPDDGWQCALDQPSLRVPEDLGVSAHRRDIGLWGRSLQTELHGKASHDALVHVAPDERPFVLTRSATTGTMRYCCSSWSGDNYTSWESMRGANALALNAGMSLIQCYGHDIGGFEGPQPTPELLLRWVQIGAYSQRFAINCFKTINENSVGDVIEPWMYPEITHLIRKAIKRRYAMIPYLYSLMLISHREALPPQRWTGWGYESDAEVWTAPLTNGETQFWLGDALLVGGVYEPGVSQARVYLPRASSSDDGGDDDPGYLNLKAPYQHLEAGQWATIDAEWHGAGVPVLARVGTALPIGRDVQVLSAGEKENLASLPLDDYRAVEIFPPPATWAKCRGQKWYEFTWYEDDGVSPAGKNAVSEYTIGYSASSSEIKVKFRRHEASGFRALWRDLVVVLPPGDVRTVSGVDGGHVVASLGPDEEGRKRFEMKFE